jgi:hypothetical protein
MKKIFVVGLISTLFSAGAYAAACSATAATAGAIVTTAGDAATPAAGEICVCDGATPTKVAVNGGSGTVITTPMFAKNGFDVQCSSSTIVSYNESSATLFAVGGGSRKGNQSVQGSSAGGAVTTSAKCTATAGCAGTDVTTAVAKAITDAGS